MKIAAIMITALITMLSLTGCTTQQNLTKSQRCDQIKRQIIIYQQPNSGYSGDMSQMKIQQLQTQSQALGC